MKDGAIEAIRTVLADHLDVVAAWLFGSRASGTAGTTSDIDIGILTRGGFDWQSLLELSITLQRSAGGCDVDLVDVGAADPILAFEAVSGRRLLVKDPGRVAEAVSLIAREYESAMELIKRAMEYRKA